MIQQYMHKLSVAILASLMLFTALGFNLSMHYCFGRLKAFSLYEQESYCVEKVATRCGWKAPTPTDYPTFAEAPPVCCEDASFSLFLDEDYQQVEVVALQELEAALAYESSFISPLTISHALYLGLRTYKPPLQQVNIPVLVQSFRL